MEMHRFNLVSVFWWLVAICIVVYVVKNPAEAGNGIQNVFNAAITFVTSMTN